jgi:hypothetical protein
MEKIHIILSISITVIVMLLFACLLGEKKRNKCGKNDGKEKMTDGSFFSDDTSVDGAGPPSGTYQPFSKPKGNGWNIGDDISEPSDSGRGVTTAILNQQYANLTGANYDDYNQTIQYMSLDPEVFTSHVQYDKDMDRTTTGPSAMAERSDPNDVVPWVGIRRIDYDVPLSSNARVEPSEFPDQPMPQTNYTL